MLLAMPNTDKSYSTTLFATAEIFDKLEAVVALQVGVRAGKVMRGPHMSVHDLHIRVGVAQNVHMQVARRVCQRCFQLEPVLFARS